MRIPLDHQSDTPLYLQIVEYLREGIVSGRLEPDTRLPASRRLADDLGVSRITIENAYAELEAAGLVRRQMGSGTYVLPPWPLPETFAGNSGDAGRAGEASEASEIWPLWQQDIRARSQSSQGKTPEDLLRAGGHPNPISFAGGSGDPRLFPVDDLRKTIQAVMRCDDTTALGYGEPGGYTPLRRTIASVLASQGLQAGPDNILITSGSQQAMALVSQLLLRPGDAILVESPTYAGALDLFRALGLRMVNVPVDEEGMQVDRVEQLLQSHHPKLIYTIPNFHNPTGTCMSGQRRRQLVALADRYNTPILEDDFVGDLRYDGRAQPALKAVDPGGRVIYTSTFSKMLMPGLRVGFVVAEGPVGEALANHKRAVDLATSSLIQRALEDYVTVGRYQVHLRRSCRIYGGRRDAMLEAIDKHWPSGAQVNSPQGGLFIWLRLPSGLSSNELLPLACEEGTAFAPGRVFVPGGSDCDNYLRLNFAAEPRSEIEEGIRRLGRAIARLMP